MARIVKNGITYGNIYDTLSTSIDNRIAVLEESEYVSTYKIDTVQNSVDIIQDRIKILEEQINKKNKRVIKIKIRG